LKEAGVCPYIMVDCSHDNSSKNPEMQPVVAEDVIRQILAGNQSIVGLMMESNLHAGNQSIPQDIRDLKYGVSVTDGCIDWDTTEECILNMQRELSAIR
jgi:3-deoxy-7-phosphoheptulonate synthase